MTDRDPLDMLAKGTGSAADPCVMRHCLREGSCHQIVNPSESLAALGAEGIRPVQKLSDPPLLSQRWKGDR